MSKQTKFNFSWLLQPTLIAYFPIIHMFILNPHEINKYHLSFALIIITTATIFLFLFTSLFYKNFFKGALVTNALIILFYGSVPIIHRILIPISIRFFDFTIMGIRILRIKFMLPILIILALTLIHRYIPKIKSAFLLQALILPLLIFFGISIAKRINYIRKNSAITKQCKLSSTQFRESVLKQLTKNQSLQEFPDVYFIILDCYTSQEYYQKVCNFDNSPFINQLKKRNFYIPEKTHSNYPVTLLSLPSILNMNYHHNQATSDEYYRTWEDNTVAFALKSLGYIYANFYINLQLPLGKNNLLNTLLYELRSLCFDYLGLGSSFIRHWTPLYPFTRSYSHEIVRQRIKTKLELLRKSISLRSPKFIYSHFLIPHHPHVFDRNGNPLHIDNSKSDLEKLHYGHVESTRYINKKIIETIDSILKQSKKPPIIILQGDHGVDHSRSGKKWGMYQILNAYHLPYGGEKKLYSTITPVNSFRVIFNHYFGTSLPLLEDKIA